jgi:ABC-type sugar transport system ATPase subunit
VTARGTSTPAARSSTCAWSGDGQDDPLREWVDREVTTGVRPEAISDSPGTGRCEFAAGVEFIEELGAEMVVHSSVAGLSASAEIESTLAAASDEMMRRPHAHRRS